MVRPGGSDGACWPVASGAMLRVRLTPKASREAVDGLEATAEGPALKARVRAAPQDGEANDAVVRLVADWLGVPRSAVCVRAGQRSRVKRLAIAGEPAALLGAIERRLAALGSPGG